MKENREKKRAFGGREEAVWRWQEGCLALARRLFGAGKKCSHRATTKVADTYD